MTREEARDKAMSKVFFMVAGDIDYYFDLFNLVYINPRTGKKKAKPTRSDKESVLIDYFTEDFLKKGEEFAKASADAQEEQFKHIMKSVIG